MILLHPTRFIRFFICSATVVVLLSFLYQTGSAQEKAPTVQPVAAAATLTKEIVNEKLAATRKTLAAISASAAKDSPEGLSRTALQRQIELLEQELGLIAKGEAQTAQKIAIEDRLKSAGDQLTAISSKSPPLPTRRALKASTPASISNGIGSPPCAMSSLNMASVWKHCLNSLRKSTRNQRRLKKMPLCWAKKANLPKPKRKKN